MLYFHQLPNHQDKRFDEQSHFAKFREHNIVFSATTTKSFCAEHVGCLSIKTVWSGMEAYEFQGVRRNVTPGQFLLLNSDQRYSSSIDSHEKVSSMSVFFTNEFSSAVFRDVLTDEDTLLDNYDERSDDIPEFFQRLYPMDAGLRFMLNSLAVQGESKGEIDERLQFALRHLLRVHRSEIKTSQQVDAIKAHTKLEIYRRLCIAKDVLHSLYKEDLDLATVSQEASMSVPQLVRQFKNVFRITPHQYLREIRLEHAAVQLRTTTDSVQVVAHTNGFENTSAFCRAFRQKFRVTPETLRSKK